MFKRCFSVALIFVVVNSLIAGTQSRFLNVDMTVQDNDSPTQIKLRIPLGLVDAMAPQIQDALEKVDHDEKSFDIRKIWAEIKNAGPTRFAEVHRAEMDLVVETLNDHVLITLDSDEKGRTSIEVQMALGDILFNNANTDLASMLETLSQLEN